MTERPVSDFSRRFAAALRGVMAERGINQKDVAARLNRSPGYVSEHMSGKRAVDGDIIAAVADAVGREAEELVEEVAQRMRRA